MPRGGTNQAGRGEGVGQWGGGWRRLGFEFGRGRRPGLPLRPEARALAAELGRLRLGCVRRRAWAGAEGSLPLPSATARRARGPSSRREGRGAGASRHSAAARRTASPLVRCRRGARPLLPAALLVPSGHRLTAGSRRGARGARPGSVRGAAEAALGRSWPLAGLGGKGAHRCGGKRRDVSDLSCPPFLLFKECLALVS